MYEYVRACYLSCFIGGRSGNRGRCAGPCRLDFRSGQREYALSLKDMSYISHARELSEAGVSSLKIEGRLKRPEYVAASVTALRKALAGEEYDAGTLGAVFSRSGFTDGYFTGRRDLTMFGRRTEDDEKAAQSALPAIRALYRNEFPGVPCEVSLKVGRDEPSVLTVSDGGMKVVKNGPVGEPARVKPLDREQAEKFVCRTGGTPFYVSRFSLEGSEGLTLPGGALSAMRREALDELLALRGKTQALSFDASALDREPQAPARPVCPRLRLRFESAVQIPSGLDDCFIVLPMSELLRDPSLCSFYAGRIAAELPFFISPDDEDNVVGSLMSLAGRGLSFALCENIGALALSRRAGLTPIGGAGLNVFNSRAAAMYGKMGVGELTASFELSAADTAQLSFSGSLAIAVYGCLPLMRLRLPGKRRARLCRLQRQEGAYRPHRQDLHRPLLRQKVPVAPQLRAALCRGQVSAPGRRLGAVFYHRGQGALHSRHRHGAPARAFRRRQDGGYVLPGGTVDDTDIKSSGRLYMELNIVLVEPEIPQNAGNIARTCAVTGARLHLVEPLGFKIDDRKLKRAGLDYWHYLDITYYPSLGEFFEENAGGAFYYFTTKGQHRYTDISYPDKCFIVFGKETAGLPEELLKENPDSCVRIPMRDGLRSLNLSNSVAIGAYEVLRQWDFPELLDHGQLHRYKW